MSTARQAQKLRDRRRKMKIAAALDKQVSDLDALLNEATADVPPEWRKTARVLITVGIRMVSALESLAVQKSGPQLGQGGVPEEEDGPWME